jgi:hypothetical protein
LFLRFLHKRKSTFKLRANFFSIAIKSFYINRKKDQTVFLVNFWWKVFEKSFFAVKYFLQWALPRTWISFVRFHCIAMLKMKAEEILHRHTISIEFLISEPDISLLRRNCVELSYCYSTWSSLHYSCSFPWNNILQEGNDKIALINQKAHVVFPSTL